MAQATTTTVGEILLAGDLFGNDGNSPQLVPSGVDPGTLSPMKKIHVDSKGRITWSGPVDYPTDIESYVPSATKSQKGTFRVGFNISVNSGVISIPIASANEYGVFKIGNLLAINQSTGAVDCVVPDASASQKGVIQVGSGFDVAGGVLSRTGFGNASASVKGMVIAGTNFQIDYGVLSVPYASASASGVAAIDTTQLYLDTGTNTLYPHTCSTLLYGRVNGFSNDFSISNGVLSYTSPYSASPATASTLGMVKIGTGFYMDGSDALTVAPDASTSSKGLAEAGQNITVTNGVISIPNGDANTYGAVCIGDPNVTLMSYPGTPINSPGFPEDGTTGLRYRRCDTQPANLSYAGVVRSYDMNNISITNGVMDVGINIAKKNTFNTYTSAQVTAKQTYIDTDWSRGNAFDIAMTANVTSVPAPTNAVPGQVVNLFVTQDATGGRTLTGWNSVYKFQNGVAPVLSTAPNITDIITIICKSSTEFYVLFTKGYQ